MPHTVNPVSTITINPVVGSTQSFKVTVENAVQPGPAPAASGTINVEFAGEVVSVPIDVQFAAQPAGAPVVSVDLGGTSGLTVNVGTAAGLGAGRYEIPITLTVA